MSHELTAVFDVADEQIRALEAQIQQGAALPLDETVNSTLTLAKQLMRGYGKDKAGEPASQPGLARASATGAGESEDVLEVFKAFVKGDPSLNAIRDNVRELVYYRNCIDMQRQDALPVKPEVMAVRTIRHIYLYLRTRSIKENRIDAP